MAQGAYVFGYGSLIEKESRTRTNPEAVDARPARVTGYQRGWFHQFANNVGSTCTYLGAIEKHGATTNGVIYHVNDPPAAHAPLRPIWGPPSSYVTSSVATVVFAN
jgi:cation transport regulator ChaC